jgi:hypothetical protein
MCLPGYRHRFLPSPPVYLLCCRCDVRNRQGVEFRTGVHTSLLGQQVDRRTSPVYLVHASRPIARIAPGAEGAPHVCTPGEMVDPQALSGSSSKPGTLGGGGRSSRWPASLPRRQSSSLAAWSPDSRRAVPRAEEEVQKQLTWWEKTSGEPSTGRPVRPASTRPYTGNTPG